MTDVKRGAVHRIGPASRPADRMGARYALESRLDGRHAPLAP